jgi:hypothetical protein
VLARGPNAWYIRKFAKTTRRHRTIQIQARPHTATSAGTLASDVRQAPNRSTRHAGLRTKLSQLRA